jgi:hypothetical protein
VKQLKISMPEELRAKLDEAAGVSGKSVAEEIRSRVEQTFQVQRRTEWSDDETRGLCDAIHWLAMNIHLNMEADWHQNRHVRRALEDAISEYMLAHQPRDTVEIPTDVVESARSMGRAFARAYLSIEQERRERRESEES